MTDNNFMDLINKSENLIIDVWAEWCKPCKLLDPIFEDLAKNYGNSRIIFAKLDGNTYRNAAKALKVMSFPTFVIFKNFNEIRYKNISNDNGEHFILDRFTSKIKVLN